jgi:polysaccharide pyruvyl transferase WcaK-like protein
MKLSILGAPGDTGNLGVTALLHATLAGVTHGRRDVNVMVFDNGVGLRSATQMLGGRVVTYRRRGMRLSRRYHRPESLANMRLSARLGGFGNAGVQALAASDAVLDISGGDSFSDLYGRKRYDMVTQPKLMVMRLGRPLVLLPQTYGPFGTVEARDRARDIIAGARTAWARDGDSFDRLQELLGPAFDPRRHRQAVDVAFGLEPVAAEHKLSGELDGWISPASQHTVVGLNVSGLLANSTAAGQQYGLRIHYRRLMERLLRRLLEVAELRIVLMPHVRGASPQESDLHACRELRSVLEGGDRERVLVAPTGLSPGEAKWLIGRFDWFCGTRMHSTIAALSSGVPAAAVAYSLKTRGVFATCGQADSVADGRHQDDDEALHTLWASFEDRAQRRETLAARLPDVRRSAQQVWHDVMAPVAEDRSRVHDGSPTR